MFSHRRTLAYALLGILLCSGLSSNTSWGSPKPDYSWLLRSPLKKHLSGAALSHLKRTYGPSIGSGKPSALPAATRPSVSRLSVSPDVLVNDPNVDVNDNSTQSEPSLAVRGDRIVIAWNDAGDFFRFGQFTGYGYSTDGGATLVDAGPLPPPPDGTNLGDPGVDFDSQGNFYISTLALDKDFFGIIGVAKSTDGGVTFSRPVNASGRSEQDFPDKPLIAVDHTDSPFAGNVYVVWTNFVFFGEFTQITFARSTDGGRTFSTPLPLSAQLASPVHGAIIGIGPEGEVYVAWEDLRLPASIRLRKSTDGGQTFGPEILVTTLTEIGDEEASSDCFQPALKGFIRVNDFPIIATDRSAGPHRGSLYIVYNSDPDGEDTSDIFLVRSTDGGATWSAPLRVNNDQTPNDQFFPFVAVAEDGTVSVMWYDRRLDPDNFLIDVFRAVSSDGGQTFINERVTTASFDVPPLLPNFNPDIADCYMGDYNWMTAQGDKFYLSWGDNRRVLSTPSFPEGRPDPDVRFAIAEAQIAPVPALGFGPSRLDFGRVEVGESEALTVVIQNAGAATLTGTIRVPAEPFSIAEAEDTVGLFELASGELLELTAEFIPEDAGRFSGVLLIESNDPRQPQVEIPLLGTGVAAAIGPAIRVAPELLDFGSVRPGTTKTLALRIRNVGSESLTVTRVTSSRPSFFRVQRVRGPLSIHPGRQVTLQISGRPGSRGLFTGKIIILSNDPEQPKLLVPVQIRGVRPSSIAMAGPDVKGILAQIELEFSRGYLRVHLPEVSPSEAQLEIFDLTGRRLVSQRFVSHALTIPAGGWSERAQAAGVYLAVLRLRDTRDGTWHGLVRRVILRP